MDKKRGKWHLPVTIDDRGKFVSAADYVEAIGKADLDGSLQLLRAPAELIPEELKTVVTHRLEALDPNSIVAGFIGYGNLTAAECIGIINGTMWPTDDALRNALLRTMTVDLDSDVAFAKFELREQDVAAPALATILPQPPASRKVPGKSSPKKKRGR